MGLTLEALAFFWTQPHSEYPPFVHCNICLIVFPISNLSSCWNRCTAVLILIQDTKPGGWFNWSDKISTWKLLRLLLYLWGCMQSSLMREGTCWFHISPLQTILRSWWNICLIHLPHSPDFHVHEVQTHFIPPPATSSPGSRFACTAETASRTDLQAGAWDPPTLSGMEKALG